MSWAMRITTSPAGQGHARSAPWSVAMLAATLAVLGLYLVVSEGPLIDALAVSLWVAVTAVVGALVAARRPENPVGWLLGGAVLLVSAGVVAQAYAQASEGSDALALVAAWVAAWLSILGFALFIFLLLRFPEGRLLSSRWRWAERLALLGVMLGVTATALMPGRLEATPTIRNPLGVEPLASVLPVVQELGQSVLFIAGIAALVSLFLRYRRGGRELRQQLKWVAYAVVLMVLAGIFAGLVETAGALNEASFFVGILGLTALPVSIGVAILRHRLFDIDLLINRTIVYTMMTAAVLALYVAIVGSLTGVIGARVSLSASLIATAIVAMAFHPVRLRLQKLVDRWLYGERDDPYAVLTGLAHRIEEAGLPASVLPALLEGIASSLKLPYAAIGARDGDGLKILATHGRPVDSSESFTLSHHGQQIGELIVSARRGSSALEQRDRELLGSLAKQIGPAVHAVGLADELQRSRSSIVRAREEERRRLRRDLHDGLGPELAGISMGLSAAERLAVSDPQEASRQLGRLNEQLKGSITSIRTIVAGLVPPELERLSLAGALYERVTAFAGEFDVSLDLDVPDELPAAVEVAAYRITLEALTNVARHARASRCSIRGSIEDDLILEIVDDGCGISEGDRIGTGMASMRERAEELGGELTVMTAHEGGTCVVARLPVGAAS